MIYAGPMMRRRTVLGTAAATAMPVGGGRAHAQTGGRDLTVVSWGGSYQEAQREVFFRPWAQARGQRLLEETWHGGIAALRARIADRTNTWDLVQVEGEEALIGCAEGLFEPLDWDAIGGREAFIPRAVQECGVGAIAYSFVLAWDRGRGAPTPTGWGDLFDTARFPGRRALRRGPKTTLEIALLADGVAPEQVYPLLATEAGLSRAFRKLDTIRAELMWWQRGSQPAQWLASGEVVLSAAYNGRITAANIDDGRDLGIMWAQNLSTLDFWVIMRGSPNRARALDFLRFVGQTEVQTGLPVRIPYGMTARGVAASLPASLLATLPTAPANARNALPIDDHFWLARIDPLGARFEGWLAR